MVLAVGMQAILDLVILIPGGAMLPRQVGLILDGDNLLHQTMAGIIKLEVVEEVDGINSNPQQIIIQAGEVKIMGGEDFSSKTPNNREDKVGVGISTTIMVRDKMLQEEILASNSRHRRWQDRVLTLAPHLELKSPMSMVQHNLVNPHNKGLLRTSLLTTTSLLVKPRMVETKSI